MPVSRRILFLTLEWIDIWERPRATSVFGHVICVEESVRSGFFSRHVGKSNRAINTVWLVRSSKPRRGFLDITCGSYYAIVGSLAGPASPFLSGRD